MNKLILLVALVAGGCSWGARGYRAVASTECSTSRAMPIVDTAIAVAGVGVATAAFASGDRDAHPADGSRSAIMGSGALAAVVYGAAAISGYTWAADCRRGARETASIARQ